ncbi:MAG: AMP-binding protein [Candidatus Neomarinimicrobiota bacterium]
MSSPQKLPEFSPNIATMLKENASQFKSRAIYQENRGKGYMPMMWGDFYGSIDSISRNLSRLGFNIGDRMAIFSRNRLEMLQMELAVMASGGVAVPIFAGYPKDTASRLVEFCDADFLAVSDQGQLDRIEEELNLKAIFHFDPVEGKHIANLIPFSELLVPRDDKGGGLAFHLDPDTVTLMMFTSGTMGTPKCVMLTHGNILSQQAAMKVLWSISEEDRFLSYLPWHHSFGGIFEMFAAITNGALFSLEHGFGKDTGLLVENWREVKPTVFFSVPKIYQELTSRAMEDSEVEELIFRTGLRFIFTAAAPLPQTISDMFESRGIPVIEGWGLTETSPCSTVTDPSRKRKPGLVGTAIPGVRIKLSPENEIMVAGPNVMKGYYKNEEATKKVLTEDGWFYTGDVGDFTPDGLRLISRKDRIFKLSNAEKVFPAEIENRIAGTCCYLSHVYVAGSGENYPVVLLFPNSALFDKMPDPNDLSEECRRPTSMDQLASCLSLCLNGLNRAMDVPYERPGAVMLLDRELSLERDELTPSMKLAPNVIGETFKAEIESLYGGEEKIRDDVYVVRLER